VEDVSEVITVHRPKDYVAHVQLNRPEVMNALNNILVNDFYSCLKNVEKDEDVRVILLSGAGKAFCAGGDVSFLNDINRMAPSAIPGLLNDIFFKLGVVARLDKPVIAALHGYALGAGLALALLCDIRIAGEKTKFGAEFPVMGLVPELGITRTLPALIGLGNALELSLAARRIDASEALRIGLISRIVPEETIQEEAMAMALHVAQLPPLAIKWTKKALRRGAEGTLEDSFQLESQLNALCYASEDHREATSAFFENRKPVFKGR